MTKHTLTPDSIAAAKALVCRLCENGHVRMSVPVDFARDEDMLICALIEAAEKSLVTPPAASGAAPAEVRERFEAWFSAEMALRNETFWFDRDGEKYIETKTQNAWLGYRAALASREASPAALMNRVWKYRRYGSPSEKGYTIFAHKPGATHGEAVAFLGDSPEAADAVGRICEAHNAALASPQVAPAPLVSKRFGRADLLLALSPLQHRPRYYLVWVDAQWLEDETMIEHVDDIYDAIGEEFGSYREEFGAYEWPLEDFSSGSCWRKADADDVLEVSRKLPALAAPVQVAPAPDTYEKHLADQAALIDLDRLARWLTDYGHAGADTREELGARVGQYVNDLTRGKAFGAPMQTGAAADDARDAARYRWLRRQCWDRASLFVVSGGKESVRLGTYCPTAGRLDELVDASINSDPK